MKSLEKHQEFIKLRGMGESYDVISAKIGISKVTLIKWSKLYDQEISELKGKALESVIETYDIAKSGRLKIVAKELSRIDGELSKRDLASIPTSRLLQIKLQALDVMGKILDATKVEFGMSDESKLSGWEAIWMRCGERIDDKEKEIENSV